MHLMEAICEIYVNSIKSNTLPYPETVDMLENLTLISQKHSDPTKDFVCFVPFVSFVF